MLELEWRPRAQLDRESITIYLGFECGNPKAAFDVIKVIDATIERVRTFPDSGGFFKPESPENREYRKVLAGKYIIFYSFNDVTLTVHRVIHQRRDISPSSLVEF